MRKSQFGEQCQGFFAQAGTHSIYARITDPAGVQAVSAPIPVRILAHEADPILKYVEVTWTVTESEM